MASYREMDHRVMGIVLRSPGRDMKEVVLECPGPMNEVFLELDCLNRPGQVARKQNRPGHYSLSRQGNRNKGLLTPQRREIPCLD